MKEIFDNWILAIIAAAIALYLIIGKSGDSKKPAVAATNTTDQDQTVLLLDPAENLYVARKDISAGAVYVIQDQDTQQRFYMVEDSQGNVYIIDHTIEGTIEKETQTQKAEAG